MGTARSMRRGKIAASVLAATALVVTGCAGGGTPESTATESAAPSEPVTLTASVTDDGTPAPALRWDADGNGSFNDGTQTITTFTYPKAGSYTAKLQLTVERRLLICSSSDSRDCATWKRQRTSLPGSTTSRSTMRSGSALLGVENSLLS